MTTENANPEQEQEQLPAPAIQSGEEKDPEEEQEQVTPETIVNRELAAIPIAEREGVQKFAKDDVFIRNDEVKKTVKKYKKKFDIAKFPLPGENEDAKPWLDKVQDARRVCRNFRTELEEEREARVKPHNDTVTFYNGVYKPLIADLKSIEAPLKSLEDKQKDIEKQRKLQEEIDRKKKIDDRVDRLKEAGAVWDGNYYYVGNTQLGIADKTLGMIDIETASDELYETILIDFKRVADEVKVKEDAEKARKKKEKEDREEQERLDKQKLIDDQAEVDRKQKLLEDQEKEQAEKTKKLNEKITGMRRKELLSLGLTHDPTTNRYYYSHPLNNFPFEQPLHEFEDEGWEAALDFIGKKITEIKEADAARETLTLARQAELVELGFVPVGQQYVYKSSCRIDVSRFTAPEEDWTKIIDYAKGCIEKANAVVEAPVVAPVPPVEEKKDEKEPERPVRHFGSGGGGGISIAEASDKRLWNTFKSLLSAIDIPEFETDFYKARAKDVKQKIQDITSL